MSPVRLLCSSNLFATRELPGGCYQTGHCTHCIPGPLLWPNSFQTVFVGTGPLHLCPLGMSVQCVRACRLHVQESVVYLAVALSKSGRRLLCLEGNSWRICTKHYALYPCIKEFHIIFCIHHSTQIRTLCPWPCILKSYLQICVSRSETF